MNTSEQIAAINSKAEDEHRAVELKRDQLIQQVRDRCVHEPEVWFSVFLNDPMTTGRCKHCGAPMGAE